MGVIDLAAFTFNFLANYTLGAAGTYIYLPTADDYLDTLTGIIAGYAIALESPVIVSVLSVIGMLSMALLEKFVSMHFLLFWFWQPLLQFLQTG